MGVPLSDKFIGFVDILGFSSLMHAATAGEGLTHDDLFEACKLLGTEKDRKDRIIDGSKICPHAPFLKRDMEFHLTQLTDAVVVSAEISPAGVINVIEHCWRACFALLLRKGLMCRGYVKRGLIYHTESNVFGPGHTEAVESEKHVSIFKRDADDKGTPFIQVDNDVVTYIASQPDKCVREMFERMTISDGSLTALFPIARLSHDFVIAGFGMPPFDAKAEKACNDVVRGHIKKLKERVLSLVDSTNPSAVRKSEHYVRALNTQLEGCDRTDEMIDILQQPFPSRNFKPPPN